MSATKIQHGRATVSWGPRIYGPPTIIANCPVFAFTDLVVAVCLACEQYLAQFTRDETRDETRLTNPGHQTGPVSPPASSSYTSNRHPVSAPDDDDWDYALRNAVG